MNKSYDRSTYLEMLQHIDPAGLDYSEWTQVGMALKTEGLSASDWDAWSSRDSARYKPGESYRKWSTFLEDAGNVVTGGTIVHLARQGGWSHTKDKGRALAWDDIITDDVVVVDRAWLETSHIDEPDDSWDGKQDLIKYLETLFEASDIVGYVTQSWHNGDKYVPSKGVNSRTQGEIVQAIHNSNDLGEALGDYNPDVGAWIRFNPLDGHGGKNVNVVDYRYALVECDEIDTSIEEQRAILEAMELPIATMVYSGGKSVHAIVRVDALNAEEYKKRVNYLYQVVEKNGLKVDQQNKNPSRLSRMPGVYRDGKKQYLMATNIGKKSWEEWEEWIESVNDDLPEPEGLDSVWDNLPPLAPSLIDGVLRQGHKMLVAGPSKAGKSFLLIQLAVAIAEGREWVGWPCTQGKVLYVNLELDPASAMHRFSDVYKAKEIEPSNIKNIDIWNLRGKSVPLDALAPKLIRRAQKKGYIAVVIDPIYKVITGDENNASEMAKFTNQFDKIATELGCAVIYCHHHSKGYQGNKRSMDRASGSGVFARDPDALLDLTELEMPQTMTTEIMHKAMANSYADAIRRHAPRYFETKVQPQEVDHVNVMDMHLRDALSADQRQQALIDGQEASQKAESMSAWRIEGTLREYASFKPRDIFFRYPTHQMDDTGMLADLKPEAEKPTWERAMEGRKTKEEKAEERQNELEIAYATLELEGVEDITTEDLQDEMSVSRKTVLNRIKEHGGFNVESGGRTPGKVTRKDPNDTQD